MANTPNKPNTLKFHKLNCACPPCKREKKAESGGNGVRERQKAAALSLPALGNAEVIYTEGFTPVLVADHGARNRILQIMALRAKGLNYQQVAEKLGLSYQYVRNLVWRAGKEGWLKFEDPLERFENEILPRVVDNIDYWIAQKDKKMTIEAAKGGGIFKSHQTMKIEGGAPSQVLALKIEMPPGAPEPTISAGKVVGRPRTLEITGTHEEVSEGTAETVRTGSGTV